MPNSPEITDRPNTTQYNNPITLSSVEIALIHKNINLEDIKEFFGGILHDIIDLEPKKDDLFENAVSRPSHDKYNLQEHENLSDHTNLFTYYHDETNPLNDIDECCNQAKIVFRVLSRMLDKDNNFDKIGRAMRMLCIYLTKTQKIERVIKGIKYTNVPCHNRKVEITVNRQPFNKTNYVYADMTLEFFVSWDKS